LDNRIACFGIPSIFSFKSKVCEGCGEFEECQDKSYSALLAIREYPIATTMLSQHVEYRVRTGRAIGDPVALDITKPIPTHSKTTLVRYALTEERVARVSAVPKKIGQFLEKVWSRGIDLQINADIANGTNPFSLLNARPYHVAFEALQRGRAHRSHMAAQLQDKLGWTYASAYSQVSMIWQIFPELGIAKIEGVFLQSNHPEYLINNDKSN
jgi:hypothetical protein